MSTRISVDAIADIYVAVQAVVKEGKIQGAWTVPEITLGLCKAVATQILFTSLAPNPPLTTEQHVELCRDTIKQILEHEAAGGDSAVTAAADAQYTATKKKRFH